MSTRAKLSRLLKDKRGKRRPEKPTSVPPPKGASVPPPPKGASVPPPAGPAAEPPPPHALSLWQRRGRTMILAVAVLFALLAVIDTSRRLTADPKEPEITYEEIEDP